MPSHPTRWGFPALLTLCLLFGAVAQPALARNPVAVISDDLEGDPGDGVLKPASPSARVVQQPVSVTGGDFADTPTVWCLPLFLMPADVPGLPMVIMTPADAWRTLSGLPGRAGFRPWGGGWHDAR